MLHYLYSHYKAVFPFSNGIGYGSIAAINLYCLYEAVRPLSSDIACRGLEGHCVYPPFCAQLAGTTFALVSLSCVCITLGTVCAVLIVARLFVQLIAHPIEHLICSLLSALLHSYLCLLHCTTF